MLAGLLLSAQATERWRLSADQTWYVSHGSGNNSNDGLTVETAFATIQGAFNAITSTVDPNCHKLTIQNVAETFTENSVIIKNRIPNTNCGNDGQDIYIIGSPGTPSNTVWNVSMATAGIHSTSASVNLSGFKFTSGHPDAVAMKCWKNGFLHYGNVEFAAGSSTFNILNLVAEGGHCYQEDGSLTLSGSFNYFVYVTGHGDFIMQSVTVSMPNVLSFIEFLHLEDTGTAQFANGVSFSGPGSGTASLGKQWDIRYNSVLSKASATIPGADAGVTAYGGFVH